MFIEHVEKLRCTADHEESWLVASLTTCQDRFVLEGVLGCHVCLRQYPIRAGVAYFGSVPNESLPSGPGGDDVATRIAAFLNVREHSTLVLAGEWAQHGHAVADMVQLTVFAVDPSFAMRDSTHLSIVSSAEGIPLASNSVHGVALDVATATPRNLASALKVLGTGGRLVAPASVDIPQEMRLLARDESYWIAEKEGVLVPLRRA